MDRVIRFARAWRSKDDHEAFAENRLHPVVHPILQEMLGFVPPEPAATVLDLSQIDATFFSAVDCATLARMS